MHTSDLFHNLSATESLFGIILLSAKYWYQSVNITTWKIVRIKAKHSRSDLSVACYRLYENGGPLSNWIDIEDQQLRRYIILRFFSELRIFSMTRCSGYSRHRRLLDISERIPDDSTTCKFTDTVTKDNIDDVVNHSIEFSSSIVLAYSLTICI